MTYFINRSLRVNVFLLTGCLYLIFLHSSIGQESQKKIEDRLAIDSLADAVQQLITSGQYEEAEQFLQTINADLSQLMPDLASNALLLNLEGSLALATGKIETAEEKCESALQLLIQKGLQEDLLLTSIYKNLGVINWFMGNNREALELHLKALSLQQKLKVDSLNLADTYNNIGLVYANEDPDKALQYYTDALAIYRTVYNDENNPSIAIAYNNIALINQQKQNYNAALRDLEKALLIWQALYPGNHPNTAFVLASMGKVYLDKNSQESANEYLNRALTMYQAVYGDRHPEIANIHNLLGNVALQAQSFDEALTHFQTALVANSPFFSDMNPFSNPPIQVGYRADLMLSSLILKAEAFESKHLNKTLRPLDLRGALTALETADLLVSQIRIQRANVQDKLSLGVLSGELYEDAVRISLLLHNGGLRRKYYAEKAFYFVERSKAALLLSAINDSKAKSFANIPPEVIEEEKQIKENISFLEQKLANKPEPSIEQIYRDELFTLARHYASFVEELESQYPAYFQLKYNTNLPTIKQIKQVIGKNSAILNYFVAEKSRRIYLFYLDKNQFKIYDLPKGDNFERYITGLLNAMNYQKEELFLQTSSYLRECVLPNFVQIPARIIQLSIIPDGRLFQVPFETLLTTKVSPKKTDDFSELPFLIKHYAISYDYSAGLFYENQNKALEISDSQAALICAPVKFQNKGLQSLAATAQEGQQIDSIFKTNTQSTKLLLYDQALEATIKAEDLKNFTYLHFAKHGYVDETQPALSQTPLQP
ncbi:MAG TPA: hypothetical protein DCM08_11225, partial [Microscillaceae bacterium]|nr:hypothetical protein [Microscillaceae bacterium]